MRKDVKTRERDREQLLKEIFSREGRGFGSTEAGYRQWRSKNPDGRQRKPQRGR